MQPAFATRLRCPACRAATPVLDHVEADDGTEVREGTLRCPRCGYELPIDGGIVHALRDPPSFLAAEAAGLDRFAAVMRDDGWDRERILRLPYEPSGYWFAQAILMEQVLDEVPFAPGETILDVGSNTCWASAAFARHGLAPTALDIATTPMQGLATADWHFEATGVFFERVLGSMFDLPFADGSFDAVWCCEVLHHNHRANLRRTYAELHRVLRPGGRLIVANEPLRTLRTPELRPGHEVAEFEGHEHAYLRASYTRLARQAGFDVQVRVPRYHEAWATGRAESRVERAAHRRPWLKRSILAARAYALGGTALHAVCTKPGG